MDFCRNVSLLDNLSSDYPPEQVLSLAYSKHQDYSTATSLDDLFPCHATEGDVNLEWLSIFVEDCLTSSGNCIPTPTTNPLQNNPKPKTQKTHLALQEFAIPSKARSKRKRKRSTTTTFYSEPLLLHQSHWLADSELIVPKKDIAEEEEEKDNNPGSFVGQASPRGCTHCLSQRTPQWRGGPLGPKTLCNACGVRFKSGRLLPEYRPAKSPTFVSYKHSNSHKKVLEMRMSFLSSDSSSS